MNEYKLYADLHIGAPHDMGISIGDLMTDGIVGKERCLLLGDIIDIANCKDDEVDMYRNIMNNLIDVFGSRYLIGNHECVAPNVYYHIQDGILFCHGHTLFYDENKILEWESREGGKGKLSRTIYSFYKVGLLRSGRGESKVLQYDDYLIDVCTDKMDEYDCHTIVFGHKHKKNDQAFYHNNKKYRVVAIPRGLTYKLL